jgi:hypothetical protein
MIRSFDWRDVGLVKTLAEHGVGFDSETGLTQGSHPLQQALLAYLMPMAGPPPTLIWRPDRTNGHSPVFGQLRHRLGEEQAWVLYMSPSADRAPGGWQQVIERLAVEAGERRAQNLLAEVNEKSPEFDALRQAGFAIYARQSLWRLPAGYDPAGLPLAAPAPLRAATRADGISVATLYSNVVPRLVQQVEPGPSHVERGYVLADGGELLAYLDVRRGPLGIWVEPVLHPEAYDQSEAVLCACLQLVPSRKEKPLYVCVRRYQDWLQEVVARVGFESLGSQAVMVKRLAVRLSEPVLKPVTVVDGHVATPIPTAQLTPHGSAGPQPYWWQEHAKTNHR